MTKRELAAKAQAEFPGYRADDIAFAVYRVFDAMKEALMRGERIEIRDFGVFQVKTRRARRARNPKTAALLDLPERRTPFFKVGKDLKERLAGRGNV
ncbi:MAG: HU family DNA-binding protein [Pseudomonadota bacterium]|nr:HU family DNA-binding protein [Pseudomonadota bacterium]